MSTVTSDTPDTHAVSEAEALLYYAGLHSEPMLLYRTGKEWSASSGPEAQRRSKQLVEVFSHPITKVWNKDLGWKVVNVMDAHEVRFTTIDVVRFKVDVDEALEDEELDDEASEDKEPEDEESEGGGTGEVSPVTIWIGIFPGSTTAMAAHNAAQDVLTLLKNHDIIDVDVDFRESIYTREASPLLKPVDELDPLVDLVSCLTPALGLRISTKARPNNQGTMALYLAESGESRNLLGLAAIPGKPAKEVLLLGQRSITDLNVSIKLRIGKHGISSKRRKGRIEMFKEREKGSNAVDVKEARAHRLETEILLEKAATEMQALTAFRSRLNKDWKALDSRVLGQIACSPAIRLGVGEQRFTEDWGIFNIERTKLGDGFQGNKIDLGTKLTPEEFTDKCSLRGLADWEFEYPQDRLLPLVGTITDALMRAPDIWDADHEPCLLVVKNGGATNTTIGRANGVFSIVRSYALDMSIHQTSMEWGIMNYSSKSEVFSKGGDSGSIIADIRGRIGGMLTGGSGGSGWSKSSDLTYATPFWWILERIHANGFPNAHLGVA